MPWFEHGDTVKLAKMVLEQLANDAEVPYRQKISELEEIKREIDHDIASLNFKLRKESEYSE